MVNEDSILRQLNLGSSKEVLRNSPASPLAQLMTALAQDVTDQLTTSLDKYEISASNNLKQSITPQPVVIDKNGVTVAISADFYWKFVNYGVNGSEVNHGAPAWGTQPPQDKSFHQSILDWIPFRSIALPEQFSSFDDFAWAIMANKKKNGEAPRPFFTDVVNQKLISYLQEPIERVIGEAIKVRILEPWQ